MNTDQKNRDLDTYHFTQEERAFCEARNNFTLRDLANYRDWIGGLDISQKRMISGLNLDQKIAIFKLSDESKALFWGCGFSSPITEGLALMGDHPGPDPVGPAVLARAQREAVDVTGKGNQAAAGKPAQSPPVQKTKKGLRK